MWKDTPEMQSAHGFSDDAPKVLRRYAKVQLKLRDICAGAMIDASEIC
jgi:hypothetical protein